MQVHMRGRTCCRLFAILSSIITCHAPTRRALNKSRKGELVGKELECTPYSALKVKGIPTSIPIKQDTNVIALSFLLGTAFSGITFNKKRHP